MGTELTTTNGEGQAVEAAPKRSLVAKMAAAYELEPQAFLTTIKTTVFPLAETNEQLMALLVVADQYGLNPFLRGELYAFPQAGGVVPVVGVDGWYRIANRQAQLDGWEWTWADQMVKPQGANASCPAWCAITIYRKDRAKPVTVREYLDEVYRPTAPWKSHPKRMLRHKCFIQGMRAAFGIGGIYDEDEADRIMGAQPAPADVNVKIEARDNASAVLAAAGHEAHLSSKAEAVMEAAREQAQQLEDAREQLGVDPYTGEVLEGRLAEVTDDGVNVEQPSGITINVGRANLSTAAKIALGIPLDDEGEQADAPAPADDAQPDEPPADDLPLGAEDVPELEPSGAMVSDKQKGSIFALVGELKLTDKQRHQLMQVRYQKDSTNDLTLEEASDLIDFLQRQIAAKTQVEPPEYRANGDA